MCICKCESSGLRRGWGSCKELRGSVFIGGQMLSSVCVCARVLSRAFELSFKRQGGFENDNYVEKCRFYRGMGLG